MVVSSTYKSLEYWFTRNLWMLCVVFFAACGSGDDPAERQDSSSLVQTSVSTTAVDYLSKVFGNNQLPELDITRDGYDIKGSFDRKSIAFESGKPHEYDLEQSTLALPVGRCAVALHVLTSNTGDLVLLLLAADDIASQGWVMKYIDANGDKRIQDTEFDSEAALAGMIPTGAGSINGDLLVATYDVSSAPRVGVYRYGDVDADGVPDLAMSTQFYSSASPVSGDEPINRDAMSQIHAISSSEAILSNRPAEVFARSGSGVIRWKLTDTNADGSADMLEKVVPIETENQIYPRPISHLSAGQDEFWMASAPSEGIDVQDSSSALLGSAITDSIGEAKVVLSRSLVEDEVITLTRPSGVSAEYKVDAARTHPEISSASSASIGRSTGGSVTIKGLNLSSSMVFTLKDSAGTVHNCTYTLTSSTEVVVQIPAIPLASLGYSAFIVENAGNIDRRKRSVLGIEIVP